MYNVYKIRIFTHMRTNIVIEDALMNKALDVKGVKTKKDAVEKGLKLLIQLNEQQEIKKYRGLLKWEGDLNEQRRDK